MAETTDIHYVDRVETLGDKDRGGKYAIKSWVVGMSSDLNTLSI